MSDRVAPADALASSAFVPDEKLLRPLKALLSSISTQPPSSEPVCRVGVALSGGPDSSALAICAAHLVRTAQISVTLIHVHHGLMAQADAWVEHVRTLAALLDLPLIECFVEVDLGRSRGVEAAAREARHQALQTTAFEHELQAVMFAHHLQDQAETVLQRLFRGAGVLGLGAMKSANLVVTGDKASAQSRCWWLRPWLQVPRQRLLQCMQAYADATGWHAVQDASNVDPTFARGVIRTQLAAPIRAHWPAWDVNLARHAELAQQASELLMEYGQLLLQKICDPVAQDSASTVLDLRQWRVLSEAQQALVIRVWLAEAGVQMPTQQRLSELCRQLNQVHAYGHDRALFWKQNDCEVRCFRGKIHLQVTI